MLVNIPELNKIILLNKELLHSIFSSRNDKNDEFFTNFRTLVQILNGVENSQVLDPWPLYTLFKSSQSLLTDKEIACAEEEITKIHRIFGDLSLKEIESNIFKSLKYNDVNSLTLCEDDIEKYLFGMNLFPDNLIRMIVNLLENKSFLDAEGSWHILMILFNECEKISSEQWNDLLPYIEKSYYKFKDWMSCFILTEIIGDKFPVIESFNMLMKLKKIEGNELRRSYIPNALEGFVRYSRDLKLRKKSYEDLVEMLSDSSNIVANESLRAYKSIEDVAIHLHFQN